MKLYDPQFGTTSSATPAAVVEIDPETCRVSDPRQIPEGGCRSMPRMQTRALQGKVARVTGGGRDVGRAIALALAEEGATVAGAVLHSGAVLAEIAARGRRGAAYRADVTDGPPSPR